MCSSQRVSQFHRNLEGCMGVERGYIFVSKDLLSSKFYPSRIVRPFNPILGFGISSDVSLGPILLITSLLSSLVLNWSLPCSDEPIKSLGLSAGLTESLIDENNYPFLPFTLPPWIQSWQTPTLMKGATSESNESSTLSDSIYPHGIGQDSLKRLGFLVEDLRNSLVQFESLQGDMLDRITTQSQALLSSFQTLTTLESHVREIVIPRGCKVKDHLTRVEGKSSGLSLRADTLLQMLMDGLRRGTLSKEERMWVREILLLKVDVRKGASKLDQVQFQNFHFQAF